MGEPFSFKIVLLRGGWYSRLVFVGMPQWAWSLPSSADTIQLNWIAHPSPCRTKVSLVSDFNFYFISEFSIALLAWYRSVAHVSLFPHVFLGYRFSSWGGRPEDLAEIRALWSTTSVGARPTWRYWAFHRCKPRCSCFSLGWLRLLICQLFSWEEELVVF